MNIYEAAAVKTARLFFDKTIPYHVRCENLRSAVELLDRYNATIRRHAMEYVVVFNRMTRQAYGVRRASYTRGFDDDEFIVWNGDGAKTAAEAMHKFAEEIVERMMKMEMPA